MSPRPGTPPGEPAPGPSIRARRDYAGPEVLRQAFRPFFMAAGIWGALSLGLWLLYRSGGLAEAADWPGLVWHGHEMLFGFAAAAMCGFLLTAIPNWTGRLPVRGALLGGFAVIWLAGRVALLLADSLGPWLTGVADLAFPVLLFALVMREIIAGRNWRNLVVASLVGLFAVANLLMHVEQAGVLDTDGAGWRLGIGVLTVLVSLIGGRVTPSFTRNWMVKSGRTALPAPFGLADKLAVFGTVLTMALWSAAPEWALTGGLALLAAVAQGGRLWRWHGLATRAEPLVLVLHLAYLWIPLGLALLGVSILSDGISSMTAMHGLTAGAFGTMILAMMTRASLGHSGRPLKAGTGTSLVYGLVTAAALLRVAAMLVPGSYDLVIILSGLAWIGAFSLFTVLYVPLFVQARR